MKREKAIRTLKSKKNAQIAAIAKKCMDINESNLYTAFFSFSGHVKNISVTIYRGVYSKKNVEVLNAYAYIEKSYFPFKGNIFTVSGTEVAFCDLESAVEKIWKECKK